MASKGPVVTGTDGSDFIHRQRVESRYQTSASNKFWLKFCIFLHFLLFLIMCLKLAEDVLDRLDIFILELEELYVPKPKTWEWLWASSFLFSFFGLSALRTNSQVSMKFFLFSTGVLALCPLFYALYFYFNDLRTFLQHHDIEQVAEVWRGYPMALLWYFFLAVAFQVHLFELVFGLKLVSAWNVRKVAKKKQ